MTTLNTAQTAKHAFPPIRVDLLDRLLDEAEKMKENTKKPSYFKPAYFGWKKK